jgi:hypothetical protein
MSIRRCSTWLSIMILYPKGHSLRCALDCYGNRAWALSETHGQSGFARMPRLSLWRLSPLAFAMIDIDELVTVMVERKALGGKSHRSAALRLDACDRGVENRVCMHASVNTRSGTYTSTPDKNPRTTRVNWRQRTMTNTRMYTLWTLRPGDPLKTLKTTIVLKTSCCVEGA